MNGFESLLSLLMDALRILGEPSAHGVAVWVLALIFAWSGVAKLRRPALAAMAMVDFGVLRRARPRFGWALGAAELLLATCLALGVLPRLVPIATAGLLWVFALLIARSLWSGESFPCFCFGEADSRISRLTLLRTGGLAVLASVLAAVGPPEGTVVGLDVIDALQAVSAAALIGLVVLAVKIPGLLRWNKNLYAKLGTR